MSDDPKTQISNYSSMILLIQNELEKFLSLEGISDEEKFLALQKIMHENSKEVFNE